jgi:hypothetical protein
MPQRLVLYYHLTWLTSPPIWWDSIVQVVRPPEIINLVSHKYASASMGFWQEEASVIIPFHLWNKGLYGYARWRLVFISKLIG